MDRNDAEFVEDVETCRFPNELAHHKEHVRLAFLYLRQHGPAQARDRIQETILRYATSQGAAHKYHVTVTLAWMVLVEHAALTLPPQATWQDLLEASPRLLSKSALEQYYSKELLASDAARQSFVEPDLAALP